MGEPKDITFDLSAPIEDSSGFVLSELRYLKEGIPFLGADEKIHCVWDHIDRLKPYLIEKGLCAGIAAKVAYKDLAGETYETEWRTNPLLYEGLRHDASQLPANTSHLSPQKITESAKIDEASESPRIAGK